MAKYRSMLRFLFPLYLILAIALTGCVQYSVGVDFRSQTEGDIIQRIQVSDRLQEFSQEVATQWLQSLEQRAHQLRGKTQRLSEQELLVRIPFHNGAELASKFNQFFHPAETSPETTDQTLPQLTSELKLHQNNWWVVVRNRLQVDVDLRSLAVLSSEGNVLLSPGSLLNLQFALTTPWGAQTISPTEIQTQDHQLIWTLAPGEFNHLEVIFWVPSPIGIGALIIIALVVGGIYLKDRIPAQAN